MSKKLAVSFVCGLVVAGTAMMLAQSTSWLTGTVDERLDTLANLQPGLGTVMIEYADRVGNAYYAAQVGNWGMAAYQLKEAAEVQEVAENTRPARKDALVGFEQGFLLPLAKDIVNQDLTTFNGDFKTMVAGCNGCHIANGFSYIVYQLPDKPKAPTKMEVGMPFSSAALQALLSGIMGN